VGEQRRQTANLERAYGRRKHKRSDVTLRRRHRRDGDKIYSLRLRCRHRRLVGKHARHGISWTEHVVDKQLLGARPVQPVTWTVTGHGFVGAANAGQRDRWWHTNGSALPGARSVTRMNSGVPASRSSRRINGMGPRRSGASVRGGLITWWDEYSWRRQTCPGVCRSVLSPCALGRCRRTLDGERDQTFLGAAVLATRFTWWENLSGSGYFPGRGTQSRATMMAQSPLLPPT